MNTGGANSMKKVYFYNLSGINFSGFALLLFFMILLMPFASEYAFGAEAVKKWTVMAYINADNNLDRYGIYDVIEMEKVGSSADVNIITQIDRCDLPARRYYITRRDEESWLDDWKLSSKLVEEPGEVDMGDYKELIKFAAWGVKNYPAEKYFLIVWNHGNGWVKSEISPAERGISFDFESGNNISIEQLAVALAEINKITGKKIDIFGMDACLMQMFEVLYEIKDYVEYVVASEETVPGNGWPYDLILKPLAAEPYMSAENLARLVCGAYESYYLYKGVATLSAVDCAMIENLANALDELSNNLIFEMEKQSSSVRSALNSVQYFEYKEHIDLGHFLEMLYNKTSSESIKNILEKALYFYSKAVIKKVFTGESLKNATGIAIYFPKFVFNQQYSYLKFSELNWDEMVKTLHQN